MSLRIGFDMDGVFADMDAALAREAGTLFGAEERASAGDEADPVVEGEAATDDAPTPRLQLTLRQQRRLWRHVRTVDGFWESLEEFEPGAIARLAALVTERSWEVIFLTKRPASAGATAQLQTQRWLRARGYEFPSVFVVQRSRGRIAAALELDVVVDDRPENCLDVVTDSKAWPILLWREPQDPPLGAKRVGIFVVKSLAECIDAIVKRDTPPPHVTTLGRVKQLLGLKDKTATT